MPMDSKPLPPTPPAAAADDDAPAAEEPGSDVKIDGDVEVRPTPPDMPLAVLLPLLVVLRKLVLWCVLRPPSEPDPERAAPEPAPIPAVDPPVPPDATAATLPGRANIPVF